MLTELVHELRAFLPPDAVLYEAEDVKPYECDGLSAYRQTPMIGCSANGGRNHEIYNSAIARKHQWLRGRHGLSGGALPHHQGVLLSLARLKTF